MTKSLDTSRLLVDTRIVKGVTTGQAARLIGVSTRTVFRWLRSGLLPEPRRVKLPGQLWHIWSAKDIARARKLKEQIRRGPKPKRKK